MHKQLIDKLLKELQQRIEMNQATLTSGAAKDMGEYKNLCGEINGLRFAQINFEDLLKRMEKDDE
jgi:hypothetical protein